MTQPDGQFPDSAYNFGSLHDLASRDEAGWDAFINAQALAGHTQLLNELYDGLPQNQGINLQSVFIQQMWQRLFDCNPGGTDLTSTLDNSQASVADVFGGLTGNPAAPFGINLWQTLFGFYCGCQPTGTTVADTMDSMNANAATLAGVSLPDGVPMGVGLIQALTQRYTGFTPVGGTLGDTLDSADAFTIIGSRITGFVGNIIQDVRSVLDSFVNGLGGHDDIFGTGFTFGDALGTSYNQAKVLADVNAWVVQQQEAARNNSGNDLYTLIDFATYSDQSSVPNPPFSTVVTSTGSGNYVLSGGKLTWPSSSGDRKSFSFFNTPTTTNYQRVGMVFLTTPANGVTLSASNGIIFRCNASHTDFGLLVLNPGSCSLYHFSGSVGAWSVSLIGTLSNFRFKAGAAYWVETAGTSTIYKVFENTTEVGAIVDTGAALGTSGSYVYAGLYGAHVTDLLVIQLSPGDIRAFALADNKPPDYPGTGATMVRTNTGAVAVTSGAHILPNGFWTATQDVSPDITADLATGTYIVTRSGRYTVTLCYKVNAVSSGRLSPALYRDNGFGLILFKAGGDTMGNVLGVIPSRTAATFTNVTLSAGDRIAGGYASDANTSGALMGDSSSFECYFSIAMTTQPTAFST